MEDSTRKLLEKHGTIILPEDIDHDVYMMIVEALLINPDRRITMFCRGDGGCSHSALAIAEMIQDHGNVIGVLMGEANSSHVTIWASCSKRYISPNGIIGLHKLGWSTDGRCMTSDVFKFDADDFERAERAVSDILAAASNKDSDFWYKAQQDAHTPGTMTQFNAEQVVDMGLAVLVEHRNYRG